MRSAAIVFPNAHTVTTGEARRDLRQRAIVDDAIAVLAGSNMMSAFEYLRTHDIALHVIERVLLEPLRRRALP